MSSPKFCRFTPQEYQDAIVELSKDYSVYDAQKALPTYSLGLSEEVGEVMGLLKRLYRGDADTENFKDKLTKELGDVLAYLVLLGQVFEIDLETIMGVNIDKINARKNNSTLTGTGSDR
jgi:NTP pyrophosphatase (non-canonical NTP hydrolase)